MKQMMLASLAAALLVSVACTAVEPNVDTPSPTATNVQILDDCPTLPCEGPLEPGAYRWTYSEPTIDFEIPSPGWKWHFSGGGLHFIVDDTSGPKIEGLYVPDGVYMLYDPTIASRDCEDSSEPGVGRSLSDLVAWLGSAPGLVVSEPIAVTVGGFEGMQLDIEIDPEWKRPCFFSERLPAVPLIFNGGSLGGYNVAIVPDQSLRWYILDSGNGVLIVNLEDDPGGLSYDELTRTGGAIVDSFAFS